MGAIRWIATCAVGLIVVGCGTAESTSPSPTSGATPVVTPASTTAPTVFTLTSPAFAEGGDIPQRHACDGEDVSPQLDWVAAPTGTVELVLFVQDPDARGFVHWLLADIPPATSGSLMEGAGDAAAHPDGQGTNDTGQLGWSGPCPPRRHVYAFTLEALSEPSGLDGGFTEGDLPSALAGKVLGDAILTGFYEMSP